MNLTQSILFCFFVIITRFSIAQNTVAELFNQEDITYTWLGVDFSNVKVIGGMDAIADWGEKGPEQFKTFYSYEWNLLFLQEGEKYDIKGMLKIPELGYDNRAINEINANASIDDMYGSREPNYSKADIQEFVLDYEFGTDEGIGIMFVMESMNKMNENARIHLVAINMSNNQILFQELFENSVGGHGLINYWARGMYEVVVKTKRKRYNSWMDQALPE